MPSTHRAQRYKGTLAERYYCNHMTIPQVRLLNHGGVTRSRGARKQPNIPMIMHDWNAGKDTERMAMVYGYADAVSMRQMVYRWRKQGGILEGGNMINKLIGYLIAALILVAVITGLVAAILFFAQTIAGG